jgi:hypothetical protein
MNRPSSSRHVVSFQLHRVSHACKRQAAVLVPLLPFVKSSSSSLSPNLNHYTFHIQHQKSHNRCQVKHLLTLLLFVSLSSRDIDPRPLLRLRFSHPHSSEANLHSASTVTTLTSSIKWHPLARHRRSSSEVLVLRTLSSPAGSGSIFVETRLSPRLIQPRFFTAPSLPQTSSNTQD